MLMNGTNFDIHRKNALEKYFGHLNPMQRRAVVSTDGPLLILAGAGSGKTTVIVNRIVNMVKFGSEVVRGEAVSEDDVRFLEEFADGKTDDVHGLLAAARKRPINPWNILAITFTNKAASELKSRIASALGSTEAEDVGASTFHSACVRILRREIELIGYTSRFTIYDSDDSLRVVKDALKTLGLDDKVYPPRSVLTHISRCKDTLVTPAAALAASEAGTDLRQKRLAEIYGVYQRTLKNSDALDFDDIINLTVKIFTEFPEVLEKYQNRYRYIMVDEYQDTNHAQYMFISLLAAKYQNLCVVGDDDQSIYKFRGADIENILSFEKSFPSAKIIKLEQNYRSTSTILDAANALIENNTERKGKTLMTENERGNKIKVYTASDESAEAKYIADEILKNVSEGQKFSDNAILYRMNAQSNMLERAIVRAGIPYKVLSGVKFYERKEIKDVMSYLAVINNSGDRLRLLRIINEPKRGIGESTMTAAVSISETLGVSLFEIVAESDSYAPLSKKSADLKKFAGMIKSLTDDYESGELTLIELFDRMLEDTGYKTSLEAQGPEGLTRLENVNELKTNIESYLAQNPEGDLSGFLEEVALYTDLDSFDDGSDYVVLMTLHTAKGLEFSNVFVAGMEEGIFPGMQSMYNPAEIEEERRLCYVGVTRAKKKLVITNAARRMLFGKTSRNRPGRFLTEIPEELCDKECALEPVVRPAARSAAFAVKEPGGPAVGTGKTAPRVVHSQGQKVSHKMFGNGEIIKVVPMGNDQLLEVMFESVGLKKIMSNYAKLSVSE